MSADVHSPNPRAPQSGKTLDPVTFEVIRHRLWAINDDQARMAARLSGSPVVYEGYDFNSAMMTADGRGLYAGVYIMHHGSAMDDFIRMLIADWPSEDIREGDMFFTNDPWWGALHANDGILAMPIFYHDKLVAWSGIVMHDDDVGGPVPSSLNMGATDRFGEAPLYPPVKMVENWEMKRDVERIKLRNTRMPETNALNLRARLAALRLSHQRIVELIDRYGVEAFTETQDALVDYVERVVRSRLREIPDGSWYAQGYLDHDGTTDAVSKICCKLTKSGDSLTFDFDGTSPQAKGPVNCARPAMEGAVTGCMMLALCYDLPWSTGAIRRIVDIRSKEGTLNNATRDAAASLASFQGTLHTQDVTANAIAKMLLSSEKYAGEAQATWAPGHPGAQIAGLGRRGEFAVGTITDTFTGGGGARTFLDGLDTGGVYHSMGSRLANAETVENRAPFLQLYRTEQKDSGGGGRYRGGVCASFGSVIHKARGPITLLTIASGVSVPGGLGLAGGAPNAAVSMSIVRNSDIWSRLAESEIPLDLNEVKGGVIDTLPAKAVTILGDSDVVTSVTNAGSGYGDPLRREPKAVADDVREMRVSSEAALAIYGVVLKEGMADAEASKTARSEIRSRRLAEAKPVTRGGSRSLAKGGKVLHPVCDCVEAVTLDDGTAAIRCCECNEKLSSYQEDYKSGLVYREIKLTDLTELNAHCDVEHFIAREFFCPGCGTRHVVDVQHRDEPILPECQFSLAGSKTTEAAALA